MKLGFWQCLHVHGRLIKQPIKRVLAGSGDEKKNAVEEHFKLKRRRKSSWNPCATRNAFKGRKYGSVVLSVVASGEECMSGFSVYRSAVQTAFQQTVLSVVG